MVANADDILRASPELYRRYVESDFKLRADEDLRVTPLGHPNAFTNPLILDRDGDGWDGVER